MTYRCMFFYLFFTSKPCDAPELSLQWCHLFYLFSLPSWPHPIIWYSIDSIYTLMIPDLQPKPLSWTPNSYGVFYLTYYYIFLNFYYFIDILLHSIYFVPGTIPSTLQVINSFNPHNNLLLFSFHRWRHWGQIDKVNIKKSHSK